MNKNGKFIESQLDRLNKFTHVKIFHEVDNDITHLEGGIPMLDQSPPNEEVLATSPKQEVQMDDMIERIGRLNLEENEETTP